ncbi:hypothetical protein DPEC_G00115830 [Dallia pectoralis]|uniref:Uncharacterized protein n=1 Tax=Dallia pectoralis TaxID=75939 RepID=A0ACC2GU20_DALPE|nr:hypothetical protein DPEC_G00115830 [Dallia pectoralis]
MFVILLALPLYREEVGGGVRCGIRAVCSDRAPAAPGTLPSVNMTTSSVISRRPARPQQRLFYVTPAHHRLEPYENGTAAYPVWLTVSRHSTLRTAGRGFKSVTRSDAVIESPARGMHSVAVILL